MAARRDSTPADEAVAVGGAASCTSSMVEGVAAMLPRAFSEVFFALVRLLKLVAGAAERTRMPASIGIYPIVTLRYSSTTLYQVSYHIQYLFF